MCSGRTLYARSTFAALACALIACSGGGVAPAARPVAAPSAAASVITTTPTTPESLPAHFTLQLTAAGQLFADGTPVVDDEDLMRRARVAAGELSEAALFGDPGAQGPRLAALFDVLLRSGFSHVRFAGRRVAAPPLAAAPLPAPPLPAPPLATPSISSQVQPAAPAAPPLQLAPAAAPLQPLATSAVAPLQAPAPAAALVPPAPAPAAPPAAAAPVAPELPPARSLPASAASAASAPSAPARTAPALGFSVQTVGLRVIGDEGDEQNRQRLVRLFEHSFPSFRRCYPLAHNSGINATYGVDLYVGKAGGTGKLQEVRSRLSGAEFRQCMEQALRKIRFTPPRKGVPVIVSYSLLFKPAAG